MFCFQDEKDLAAGIPFICQYCGKSHETSTSLKLHEKRHIEAKRIYECSYCDKTFKVGMWYKIHLKSVHDIGPPIKSKQCQVCERWFKHQKHLNDHRYNGHCPGQVDPERKKRRNQKNVNLNKCSECKLTCISTLNLKIHLYEAHNIGEEPEKMQCDGCGMWAKNIVRLNAHKSRQNCGTLKRRKRKAKVKEKEEPPLEPEVQLEEALMGGDPMPSTSAGTFDMQNMNTTLWPL